MKRPIIDEDGKANHVLGVATDITERKRVEEEGSCGARLFPTNQLLAFSRRQVLQPKIINLNSLVTKSA